MTILVAIPTLNLVTSEFVQCLMNLRYPMNTKNSIRFIKYQTVDKARTMAVEMALNEGYDYLFFIDDDLLFTGEVLQKMVMHNVDICNGVYYRKQIPSDPLIFKEWNKGTWLDYPEDSLVEVKGCGLGMTLIKVSALKKLYDAGERDFFVTAKGSLVESNTEDIHFYKLCDKHGIKVHCDTSIQCGHQDKTTKDLYFKGKKYSLQEQEDLFK